MSTDLFEDLGERLDRLAGDNAPELAGIRPAAEPPSRWTLLALLAAGAAALVVFALARSGTQVETESPAERPEVDAGEAEESLGLPAWVQLPVVEPPTGPPFLRDFFAERFDLTTLRRLPVEIEFYTGLSPDHQHVMWAIVGADDFVSSSQSPVHELLGANLSSWGWAGSADGSFTYGMAPASIVRVEIDDAPVPTAAGAWGVPFRAERIVYVDATGSSYADPWMAPRPGMPGALVSVAGDVDDRSIALDAASATCLRTSEGLTVSGALTLDDGDAISVTAGPERIELSWATNDTIVSGTATGDEISTADDLVYVARSETLEATIAVSCPDETPHLDDLVAAMRGRE